MTVLDDLSGFEFEDVMVDVFRKLGYENVQKAPRVADVGRDIIMEERIDGTRRAVVVECKHTATVGRPDVQKLHSAVATYEYDGPKRGMAATSGEFSGPARSYVESLRQTDDPYPIELFSGRDLREVAEDIGLDLYNGRIEILCERTFRPFDGPADVERPLREAFDTVANIDAASLPDPTLGVEYLPYVRIDAAVEAVFETSVGVVHAVDEREALVVCADETGPRIAPSGTAALVRDPPEEPVALDPSEEPVSLDPSAESGGAEERRVADPFEDHSVARFERTETEYRDWAVDRLRRAHATTVRYTGDNNVTYTKECEPTESDVTVEDVWPVYLPRVTASLELGAYEYEFVHDAAGPARQTVSDGVRRCVQCGTSGPGTYTYCENCGSINCADHVETERLVGDPVCTGCAVTGDFFFSTKYFYDEDNRAAFRTEYEAMPLHQKALENRPLVAVAVVLALLLVGGLAVLGLL